MVCKTIHKRIQTISLGYQLFHNYIRSHSVLDGRTPAQACGIDIQGDNKWMTLIQNAKLLQHHEL